MQLLVINPNTSVSVTERLREHVSGVVGSGVTLHTATARFGASYIADEASFAVAGHAAIDAYALHCERHGEPDAVLLGCFGDPGVWALRQLTARPVIGLAEAAMREAATWGRFAIVTGGAAWQPMLERLAHASGFGEALAGVLVVAANGAQLAADPVLAQALLTAACRGAAVGANAIVLGGAGLAGMAAGIASTLQVPLIDSVSAGARAIMCMSSAANTTSPPATGHAEWEGVSEHLLRRFK